MLKIYLARHGQDKDNVAGILNGHRDEPLTERGEEQAREVGRKIKDAGINFTKIYSSPLKRALQTAEIIADHLKKPAPQVLQDLIERDFGVMTGKPHSKIIEMRSPNILLTQSGVTYFLNPRGAETFPQLFKRGKRLLTWLMKNHKNDNVLLISHGDIGKMIYAAYYNLDWKLVLKMFHFGNSDLLLLSPDSPAEETHVFKIKQDNL